MNLWSLCSRESSHDLCQDTRRLHVNHLLLSLALHLSVSIYVTQVAPPSRTLQASSVRGTRSCSATAPCVSLSHPGTP